MADDEEEPITGADLPSRNPTGAQFRPTSKAVLRRGAKGRSEHIPTDVAADWPSHAERFIIDFAKIHVDFTSEDLWIEGLIKPPNPREMGNVLTKLNREGVIKQAGKTRKSQLRHRTKLTVWKLVE